MGQIIDGKAIASNIRTEIKQWVANIRGRKPCLAVIIVGSHGPSTVYVARKVKACEEAGILSIRRDFPSSVSEQTLLQEITQYNQDPKIDGILVQLPLPQHIDLKKVLCAVSPEKDVDGFHPKNIGMMLIGDPQAFIPCTPLGIKVMLEKSGIEVRGKDVVIIGRSNIVGKPLANLLLQNTPGCNATVTVVHSASHHIAEHCRRADILIACLGKPKFITQEMVKEGAVVVDVGISKVGNAIVGDVDFAQVKDQCSFITPVPGGVGPMTIAMLLKNTLQSYQMRQHP